MIPRKNSKINNESHSDKTVIVTEEKSTSFEERSEILTITEKTSKKSSKKTKIQTNSTECTIRNEKPKRTKAKETQPPFLVSIKKTTTQSLVCLVPSGTSSIHPARNRKRVAKNETMLRRETKSKMPFFSHLPQFERSINLSESMSFANSPVHPGFIAFGLQMMEGRFFFQFERCLKFIDCIQKIMSNLTQCSDFIKLFVSKEDPSMKFLSECRPLCTGMESIRKQMKVIFTRRSSFAEEKIKKLILDSIENYKNERIIIAGNVMSNLLSGKIRENDVVLTYSNSLVIFDALVEAAETKTFRVIVVDSSPRFHGRCLLKKLVRKSIKCSYMNINAVSVVIQTVSLFVVHAEAMLANGAALTPAGSAILANLTQYYHKPILVCAETHCFSERAQTDAFMYNELGDPDDILPSTPASAALLNNWKSNPNISLCNLYYDVIPAKYIDAVITEVGFTPTSLISAILQHKNDKLSYY